VKTAQFKLNRRLFLACILAASCSRPSQSQIDSGYQRLRPIVDLVSNQIAQSGEAPSGIDDLKRIAISEGLVGAVDGVNYVQISDENKTAFKVWIYVYRRCSLWYVSFDEGDQSAGWFLDCETGESPHRLKFEN
jgi:hypothetical protein